MSRQRGAEVGPLLVEVETRGRRSVRLHRLKHFRQPGEPSFGELQLLQELADTAVAGGHRRHLRVRGQMPRLDARHRSRIADDLDPAGIEIDLRGLGLVDVVAAVIYGVDEGLAQRRQRVADPAADLASIVLLLEMVRREILEVVQAVPQLVHERAAEGALLLHVPRPIRGELDDVDPRAPEPLHGIVREKQQRRIAGRLVFIYAHGDPHAPVDLPFVRLVEQPTPHVAQILANLRLAQVFDAGLPGPAVVPRHAGSLLHQAPEQVAALLGIHGLGAETDPVSARPAAGIRRAVWPRLAGRRPHHQEEAVSNRFGRKDGLEDGIEPVALAANPVLRRLDLFGRQAGGWQGGPPFRLADADDDVAAVQVVVVVRERADGPEHRGTRDVRIPSRLEFDPFRLHAAAIEEIVEIYRKDRAHERVAALPGGATP